MRLETQIDTFWSYVEDSYSDTLNGIFSPLDKLLTQTESIK